MPQKLPRGSADIFILAIIVGAMIAGAFMAGGFPSSYDELLPTPIPSPVTQSEERDVEIGNPESSTSAGISSGSADLVIVDLKLTDADGNEKTIFDPGERIYPKVTHNNIGTKQVETPAGYIFSQIYDNQPTPARIGQESDVDVWMRNGRYSPNFIKTYEAYPQGQYNGFFMGEQYWVRNNPGTFTARAYINYDRVGIESNYDNNQRTITYTIRNKPNPTPTRKPTPTPKSLIGNTNTAPTATTCNGKYSLSNPLGLNFGDPNCNATKDSIFNYLKQQDPENASYWFYTVIPCEAPGYNPNTYYRCGPAGCTPDPNGAWGLFQMGRGRNGQYDHGDVNWPKQISNATTYRRNIGWSGWKYWACAESRW